MYCEDYIDPFDCDPDDDEGHCADDKDEWECTYPGRCLMPDPLHHWSECYTVADMEAYYAEVEGIGV